jgi:hypothetical protein
MMCIGCTLESQAPLIPGKLVKQSAWVLSIRLAIVARCSFYISTTSDASRRCACLVKILTG